VPVHVLAGTLRFCPVLTSQSFPRVIHGNSVAFAFRISLIDRLCVIIPMYVFHKQAFQLLSSRLLSRNVKVKMYKIIILLFVLFCVSVKLGLTH
jgi:hypothetical protein